MSNMQQTVQLSQKEKLQKFKEKLQMMKNKNIQKIKQATQAAQQKQETSQLTTQIKNQQKVQQSNVTHPKENEDKDHSDGQQQKGTDKTKLIRKDKNGKTGNKKQKDVTLRKAAGQVWRDKTLQQWPQNDYRIYVGNLGNQVTDQMLSAVFRNKYNSFLMARVVLDKRTGKSKGYGFVSIKEPKDFLSALKQMNNRYIGNRPVKLTKSSWKQRSLQSQKNKQLPSDFKANSGKQTNKICLNFKYVSPY